MRPIGSPAELERRRIRAVELIDRGESCNAVARILGIHATSIRRWQRQVSQGVGLKSKPASGRPARLTVQDCERLEALLLEGAEAHGWPNNLWTGPRVGKLIKDRFGVKYNPVYVCEILKRRLGWTPQKPQRLRADGDDAAIALWVKEQFPRILSEAAKRDAHLAFVDETGFMLDPTVRRTYAPRGKTPILRIADTHARISTIGAITVDARRQRVGLVYNMLGDNGNFRGPGIAYFVRMLQTAIGGPVTIIWDRITIHSCEEVERCLKRESGVVVEAFPPYAPTLNPADGVWGYIKYGRLPNYTPPDLDVLRTTVTAELDRLRREEHLLRSFIRHTKLPVDV